MKKFGIRLIILFATVSNPLLANEDDGDNSSFQKYFAKMRQCLSSNNIKTCLPTYISSDVAKPGPNYTRDEFVNLVLTDPSFKGHVSSCFDVTAQIITKWYGYRLIRSSKYACSVNLIDNKWKLESFYNFFSNE